MAEIAIDVCGLPVRATRSFQRGTTTVAAVMRLRVAAAAAARRRISVDGDGRRTGGDRWRTTPFCCGLISRRKSKHRWYLPREFRFGIRIFASFSLGPKSHPVTEEKNERTTPPTNYT